MVTPLFDRYAERYGFQPPRLHNPISDDTRIVVVIPCHNEPNVCAALDSLYACVVPDCSVEIIVVINASEDASKEVLEANEKSSKQIEEWSQIHVREGFETFCLVENNLPHKHAGVGLARKIGLDEGARRLEAAGRPNGILAWFDADTTCQPNYLVELLRHFDAQPEIQATSIHYEHPLSGSEFPDSVYVGIKQYELFLRYFIQGQRWAGHPHAIHTIGSSLAVRADAYMQQGGMNRRKAGEDFYFLQKFIELGKCSELTSTTVIPSPRPSDRVPFGTGKAINDWLGRVTEIWPAYDPQTFIDLKAFIDCIPELERASEEQLRHILQSLPASISDFLSGQDALSAILEVQSNSASSEVFRARFFRWFNAFRVLKYVHFARDEYYPAIDVNNAAEQLLAMMHVQLEGSLLCQFRTLDRG